MSGPLPSFVIIGAQKCGTTALHSYLARHPQICMSRPKELDFFVAEKNWDRGLEWYHQRWKQKHKEIRGESSPNYTAYPKFGGVPERMASLIPDAKLIFMVRDPVDRVRASYIHAYSNAVEARPMREAVLDPGMAYVARSRYHEQLTQFLDHYPMERILLIEQGELLTERRTTLQRVFAFVGARDDYWQSSYKDQRLETAARRRRTRLGVYAAEKLPIRHWRKVRDHRPFSKPFVQPEMEDSLRTELEDLLRDDAAAFRKLTGRSFETWSVWLTREPRLRSFGRAALVARAQALGEGPLGQRRGALGEVVRPLAEPQVRVSLVLEVGRSRQRPVLRHLRLVHAVGACRHLHPAHPALAEQAPDQRLVGSSEPAARRWARRHAAVATALIIASSGAAPGTVTCRAPAASRPARAGPRASAGRGRPRVGR